MPRLSHLRHLGRRARVLGLLALVLTGVRPRARLRPRPAGRSGVLPANAPLVRVYVGNLPWLALATLQALFLGLGGPVRLASRTGVVRPLAFALVWVVVEGSACEGALWRLPVGQARVHRRTRPSGTWRRSGCALRRVRRRPAGALLAAVASRALGRMELSPSPSTLPAALAVGLALVGARSYRCQPRDRRRSSSVSRATCPAPASTSTPSGGPCSTTTSTPRSRGAEGVAGAAPPRPRRVARERLRHRPAAQRGRQPADPQHRGPDRRPLIVGGLLEEPTATSPTSRSFEPGKGETDRTSSATRCRSASTSPTVASGASSATRSTWCARLLPGSEVGLFTIPTASGQEIRAGLSICFEVAYDDIMRDVVDAGANVLVVQTNNATFGYTAESPQQLAISRLRAMEFGRSVVHVSTVGQSALITPDGTATRSPRCSPRPSSAALCHCGTRGRRTRRGRGRSGSPCWRSSSS